MVFNNHASNQANNRNDNNSNQNNKAHKEAMSRLWTSTTFRFEDIRRVKKRPRLGP